MTGLRLTFVGLIGAWVLSGLKKMLIKPRFSHRELFPDRKTWNIKIINRNGILNDRALECTAKIDLHRILEKKKKVVDGMPLLWLDSEDYTIVLNKGDKATLDMITFDHNNRKF